MHSSRRFPKMMALGFSSSSSLKERRPRAACERSRTAASRSPRSGAPGAVMSATRSIAMPLGRLRRAPPRAPPACACSSGWAATHGFARSFGQARRSTASVAVGAALHLPDGSGRRRPGSCATLCRSSFSSLRGAIQDRPARRRACAAPTPAFRCSSCTRPPKVDHRVAQRQVGHLVDQRAEAVADAPGSRDRPGPPSSVTGVSGTKSSSIALLAGHDALRCQACAQPALHQGLADDRRLAARPVGEAARSKSCSLSAPGCAS